MQTRQKRDMADLGSLAMPENDVGDFYQKYRSAAAKEAILASKLKNLIKFYKFELKFSPNLNR